MWFWSAFDRSWLSSSWARNDESLDEPLAHQKHATDQKAGPVLQSVEAAPELSDDIERSLEADFSDQDASALRRFDLERLDQVVGKTDHPQGFAGHLRGFDPQRSEPAAGRSSVRSRASAGEAGDSAMKSPR